ncbi:MAG: nucleotide pyrophosphohydrolase [Erysipelotrichaceae bacterium]|nr:nucleotide pyrophosphohydrolase [Erysipelotrichaceae bacterium]
MEKLLERIDEFVEERDWGQFHTNNNLAKSIVLEANELLEHFQFSAKGDNDEQGVKDELADVMTYCLMMCIENGYDPIELINLKLDKNAAKYPVDKARGSNKKYNKL